MHYFDDQKQMQKSKQVKEEKKQRRIHNRQEEQDVKKSFGERFIGKKIVIGKLGVFQALSGDQHKSKRSPKKNYPSDAKIQQNKRIKRKESELINNFRHLRQPDYSQAIIHLSSNKDKKSRSKILTNPHEKSSRLILKNVSEPKNKELPKRIQSERVIAKAKKKSKNKSQEQVEIEKQIVMIKKMPTEQIPSSRIHRIKTSVDIGSYRERVLEKEKALNLNYAGKKLPKIENINKSERMIRGKAMMSEPSSPKNKPKKFFEAYFDDEETLKHFKILQKFEKKMNLISKQLQNSSICPP